MLQTISKRASTLMVMGMLCILSLLLVLLLPGEADAGTTYPDRGTSSLRVALFLGQGTTDEDYNHALVTGLERAQKELGIRYQVVTAEPDTEEAAFLRTAGDGYDLVLVPTARLHSLLANNAGNFPKVKFGAIDSTVKAPNILSVTFAEAESAFLCGAAAAMFTTKPGIQGVNPDRVIGWVGATDTWEARNILNGFTQGARLADPAVRVEATFTGAFPRPEDGRQAALRLYGRGADVVAAGEGVSGRGVLQAAREKGLYAIGLNVDQDAQAPGHVLTSQIKALEAAVFQIIKTTADGSFPGGEVLSRNLADGGVGVTDMHVIKQALGACFSDDIPKRLNELAYELKRGGIKAGSPPRKGLCNCL